jgi:hypothetical protein
MVAGKLTTRREGDMGLELARLAGDAEEGLRRHPSYDEPKPLLTKPVRQAI